MSEVTKLLSRNIKMNTADDAIDISFCLISDDKCFSRKLNDVICGSSLFLSRFLCTSSPLIRSFIGVCLFIQPALIGAVCDH